MERVDGAARNRGRDIGQRGGAMNDRPAQGSCPRQRRNGDHARATTEQATRHTTQHADPCQGPQSGALGHPATRSFSISENSDRRKNASARSRIRSRIVTVWP
ncbi:Uncharacterised protein [Mycobacteroides abscessus subsp. abscessus]|nr:Uncharacterised protein [Mycobacteroides abscessus subsp. abscessus]